MSYYTTFSEHFPDYKKRMRAIEVSARFHAEQSQKNLELLTTWRNFNHIQRDILQISAPIRNRK